MRPQEAKQLLKETVAEGGELDLRYENAKLWIYEQIKQGALSGKLHIHIPVYSQPFSNEKSLSSFGIES
jgi:ABC-type oligopeptide transport system substrate-binding subunit